MIFFSNIISFLKRSGPLTSLLLLCAGARAMGATARGELAARLIEENQSGPPLFQGTPITHIVPEFNTVTYAADMHDLDTTVQPVSSRAGKTADDLRYTGWVASPYLALSLKKIGLGFNMEAGKKTSPLRRGERQSREARGLCSITAVSESTFFTNLWNPISLFPVLRSGVKA